MRSSSMRPAGRARVVGAVAERGDVAIGERGDVAVAVGEVGNRAALGERAALGDSQPGEAHGSSNPPPKPPLARARSSRSRAAITLGGSGLSLEGSGDGVRARVENVGRALVLAPPHSPPKGFAHGSTSPPPPPPPPLPPPPLVFPEDPYSVGKGAGVDADSRRAKDSSSSMLLGVM
jgi:hypothetical protein